MESSNIRMTDNIGSCRIIQHEEPLKFNLLPAVARHSLVTCKRFEWEHSNIIIYTCVCVCVFVVYLGLLETQIKQCQIII